MKYSKLSSVVSGSALRKHKMINKPGGDKQKGWFTQNVFSFQYTTFLLFFNESVLDGRV